MGGSECAVSILVLSPHTMGKEILLNIQQASRSCNKHFFPSLLVVLFLVYPRRVIQKCIMQPMFDCMFDHILGRFICEKCFAAYLFTNEKYNIFIIGRILYVLAVIPTIQRKEIILFKNVSVFDCIDIMHVGRCK